MFLSKSSRLYIFTALTLIFCVVEFAVGYAAHSLALLADAVHMLSDVFASIIALYAIHLAKQTKNSPRWTFGFQRAEILGALINSVFLLALCFNIYVQAIERFFSPKRIFSRLS